MYTIIICPNCKTEFTTAFSSHKWLYNGITTIYLKEGYSEDCPHCETAFDGLREFKIPKLDGRTKQSWPSVDFWGAIKEQND